MWVNIKVLLLVNTLKENLFTNPKGGQGNSVESDLVMEHSVRNRKDIIRSLGANKTEGAIVRATLAADTVATITRNFDSTIGITVKSGRHTKFVSDADRDWVKQVLRRLRPFKFNAGKKYQQMPRLHSSPLY